MTNPTESPAALTGTATQLLLLVSEMRGIRDRAALRQGRPVTFSEIADASLAGRTYSASFHKFLIELAQILDTNSPQDVDSELDKEWRNAVQTWLKERS